MAKAKAKTTADPPEEGRGIENTLADLGFDKDVTPEEAATDAANNVASSTVVEDEDMQIPDPASDDIPLLKLPDPDPSPPPSTPLEADSALVPPPQMPRSKKRDAPRGAASKVGKALAAKVPGSDSVKVYKRTADGKLWYVDRFTTADLSAHDGFESFLTEHVKPQHGSGEYQLTAPDKKDHLREHELGTVRLLGNKTTSDQGMAGVLQTLLAQNQSRDADWLERMEKTMQPPPQHNPIDLLKGVMEVSEKVNGKTGESEAAATKNMAEAMKSSGDTTMQMMMMMQQQQADAANRQMQMMMAMFNKPKEEDPVMKLLLAKMMKDDESGSALPPPPPPPPPPPQQDNTVALITALAGFMGAIGGDGGGDDDFKEFLKTQLAQNASQGLTMKETLELLTQSQGKQGDGFKDAVENMAAIMTISQNVSRQNEGGPAAGVWDAVASLLSNRDFAGAVANTIRAKTDQSGAVQKTGLDIAQQRLAMQQRLALRQQQQAILASHQAAAAGGAVPPQQHLGQPGMQPVSTSAATPPTQQEVVKLVPPVPPATAATTFIPITADQQRAAESAAEQRNLPPLPADTYTHINNIAFSADDAERVERTVRMLIYFSEFENWRVFIEQILGYIREGVRGGAMRYLEAFFEGFSDIHLVTPALGKKILHTMDEHFEALQTNLRDFELESDRVITGDDLLHPLENTGGTNAAPRDRDDDPEGEGEDLEDLEGSDENLEKDEGGDLS